ncbi:aromatic prenyltransferase [Streptomyces sp. SBT349]|uniref:aromatic prenyltransferase n=1 Tax=Streptomyces sp. SBT349 TaxID=1580539 RepID=UPI001F2108F0|nr:aromatic prenyltransferase [Streptomyces sp. SBT349]
MEDVYAAIEKTAGLLNVPCSRDKVWPILMGFGPFEGGIIFSTSTGAHAGDLDLTIQVASGIDDPYAHAVSKGFLPETDHPVGELLADIEKQCTVNEYLIDCGVVGGLNKIYVHFPRDLQTVPALAEIPSMPRALGENAGFFARHGLENVTMIAIDYRRRTMNPYFTFPTGIDPETIRSMLREIGVPEPEEEFLESSGKSFRVYTTFSWDSPRIERISFARRLDRPVITPRVEPEITRFLTGSPYTYDGERFSIQMIKWSPDEQWFSAGSYYQFGPLQWEVLKNILR